MSAVYSPNIMTKEEWVDVRKNNEYRIDHDIPFKDIFDKYVPGNGDLFEIGCYPGDFSAYLGKKYNYRVNGIDFTPSYRDKIVPAMKQIGVEVGEYVEDDFLDYDPTSQYDLVCSFGFIEHFKNTEEIINKHITMVKKGGILIITCPNFKGANYILHKYLDNENLNRHNLNSMDLQLWKDCLEKNDMDVLFNNYYDTFGFWYENDNQSRLRQWIAFLTTNIFRLANSVIKYPSPMFSPFLISVSRKRNE